MIIVPPKIVSKLGCSLITIQTHTGPSIVSSKKKRFTSAAVMYLGANVIRTKGRRSNWKKAIVSLVEGNKIDLVEGDF